MSGLVQRRVELRCAAGRGRCGAAALQRRGHGRGPTARRGAMDFLKSEICPTGWISKPATDCIVYTYTYICIYIYI